MKSLTDLNTASAAQLTYTDTRDADVIWVKVNDLELDETSTDLSVTVKHSYDIKEIIQPQLTNIIYEINVPAPLVPSWPNFPSELTLIQVGTVYKILGITTIAQWNAIKNGTITAPADYQGTFTYEVDLKYFDTVGEQTLHWEVNEYLPVSLLEGEFTINALGGIRYPLASEMFVFASCTARASDLDLAEADLQLQVTLEADVEAIPPKFNLEYTIENFADNYEKLSVSNVDLLITNKVYSLSTGIERVTLNDPENNSSFGSTGDRFIDSNNILIQNAPGSKVYLYDINGNLEHTFNITDSEFVFDSSTDFGFTIKANTDYICIGTATNTANNDKIFVYDRNTYQLLRVISNPEGSSFGSGFGRSFDIEGNTLVAGFSSYNNLQGRVYVIDLTTGNVIRTVNNIINQPYQFGRTISVSNGKFITTEFYYDGGATIINQSAYLFDISTGNLLHTFTNPNPVGTSQNDRFAGIALINDNTIVITAEEENDITGNIDIGKAYQYDTTTGSLEYTVSYPSYIYNGFDFNSPSGISYAALNNEYFVTVRINREDNEFNPNAEYLIYSYNKDQ